MGFIIKNNILEKYIEEEGATQVIIPDSVREISNQAFYQCHNISRIILPKSIEEENDLHWGEFEEILVDSDNPYLASEDGVLYDKDKTVLIKYPCKRKNERFVVPDSVEMIGFGAFDGCSYLKEIIIPDGVECILEHAFEGCSSLGSLRIPEKCTYLGEDSLMGCDSLKEIIIPDRCRFRGDMPDDALGVGRGFSEEERLKIKIKYRGGVYNYRTYYDAAPFDEDGNYIGE